MAELEIDVVSKASGDGLTKATDQVKELTSATAAHNTTAEAAATAEKGVETATEGAAIAGKVMSTVLEEIASVAIPAMIAAAASLVTAMQQAAKEMQENNLATILHGQMTGFDGLTEAAASLAAGIKQSFGDVREEARLLDEDLKRNLGNIDQTLQQTLKLIEAQKRLALAKAGNDPEAKAAAAGDAEQQAYEVTKQAKIEALNAQKENAAKSKALAEDAAKRAEAARTESNRIGDINKATDATVPGQLKALDEEEKKAAAELAEVQANLDDMGPAPAAGTPDPGSLSRTTAQTRAQELEERLFAIRGQRQSLTTLRTDRQTKANAYGGTATQQEAAAKALAEKAARDADGVDDLQDRFKSWDANAQRVLATNDQTRGITTSTARSAAINREVAAGKRAAVKGIRTGEQQLGAAEGLFAGKDVSDGNQDIYLRAAAVLQQGHPALRALIDAFVADQQLTHQEIAQLKQKVEAARRVRKADKGLE